MLATLLCVMFLDHSKCVMFPDHSKCVMFPDHSKCVTERHSASVT